MPDRKRRILLVDDDESIIKVVGKRLEVEGFEVLTAMDGKTALAKAYAEKPDLIIMDLMLPGLDGFQATAELKKDQNCHDIPIIVVFSGKGDEQDESRSLKLGAAAYITKGEGTLPLLREIRALIGKLKQP